MRKYLFALLAVAALFTGCEKSKEQPLPEVSFETASPLLSDAASSPTTKDRMRSQFLSNSALQTEPSPKRTTLFQPKH